MIFFKKLVIKIFNITPADFPSSIEARLQNAIYTQTNEYIKREILLKIDSVLLSDTPIDLKKEVSDKVDKIIDKSFQDDFTGISDKEFISKYPEYIKHP